MTNSMSLGYLQVTRYFVAVFQTASLGGNSAVAADPVHQLPTAEVVVPAPVLVEAAGVERHPRRGADPEVVVHPLGRLRVGALGAGVLEVGVARRQPDLDAPDLA